MPATIGTTAELDRAMRRAFSDASVRLKPDAQITDIVAALTALGINTEIIDGVLCLSQGVTQMNTALALRNFAQRPEHEKFFVQQGAHPSTWSTEKKIEYLKTHSDEEYRTLLQQPVLESGVRVLDPNMSKTAYKNLTRAEKVQFIREFGSDATARIMIRK
jgi:hypothetical protein